MTEREYWYLLLNTENITLHETRQLIAEYGSPREVFSQSRIPFLLESQQHEIDKVKADSARLLREYEMHQRAGIRMVLLDDDDYPERLRLISDCPYGIFVRGTLYDDSIPSVAMVGARKSTLHGRWMASALAGELAGCGIVIVSGMAEGIDGSSHLGALEAGGRTCAVLGSGIDVCYPPCHEKLYHRLAEAGCIVSEYGPGRPVTAYSFPLRNRIISALSDVVIVVEARERSGSLITVSRALEQGKDVMAVPGRPDDSSSVSCNRLIREGAGMCTCVEDVLTQLDLLVPSTEKIDDLSAKLNALSVDELLVYKSLTGDPRHTDDIMADVRMDYRTVIGILVRLELIGLAVSTSNNMYRKK